MLWVLGLHISSLLIWCAALLYLPVLMVGVAGGRRDLRKKSRSTDSVERLVFTHFATPAALVAVMSGTLVFVFNRTLDGWLIAKLTLVVGLVVCHTLMGLLLLRSTTSNGDRPGEMPVDKGPVALHCVVLEVAQVVLIAAILWIVLAKPSEVPGW